MEKTKLSDFLHNQADRDCVPEDHNKMERIEDLSIFSLASKNPKKKTLRVVNTKAKKLDIQIEEDDFTFKDTCDIQDEDDEISIIGESERNYTDTDTSKVTETTSFEIKWKQRHSYVNPSKNHARRIRNIKVYQESQVSIVEDDSLLVMIESDDEIVSAINDLETIVTVIDSSEDDLALCESFQTLN